MRLSSRFIRFFVSCMMQCVLILALLLFNSTPAQAHKVNIFAYVEGDTVHTQSYFSDGKRCRNTKVTVYDSDGTSLLEGTTDREGLFSFKTPKSDDLRIVLEASMGHRNEYQISRDELGAQTPTATAPAEIDEGTEESTEAAKEIVTQVDIDRIAQLIDRSLAKRLRPIAAAITKLQMAQERPKLKDVIGGIGYIVGLMGLVMYLRSRKR